MNTYEWFFPFLRGKWFCIKYLWSLFFCIYPVLSASAQVHALDSAIRGDLISRLSDKGRNPVCDVELVYKGSANYTFHASYELRKGQIQKTSLNRVFKSASVAKPFIAALVMQLHEEGALSLDSPITRYLTDPIFRSLIMVDGCDYTSQLNPRNLLNHTAALHDYIFDDPRFMMGLRLFPRREFAPLAHIERYKKHKLNRYSCLSLGSYSYSDTHYLLLALLIEKVSGKSLQENIATRIVRPAHLQSTYVDVPDSGYARALIQRIHRRRITGKLHPSFEFGGGGLMTTAEDLSRFMQAVFSGVLLRPETLNTMLATNPDQQYVFGWMRKTIPVRYIDANASDSLEVFGHLGYFGVEMMYIPSRNISWVFVKGQSHNNPHARNLPIGLSLLKYDAYYLIGGK